jgi:hypothetical protein
MIAEFLRAEIDSRRFGLGTAEEMVRQAATLDMLRCPDIEDEEQNTKRAAILAHTRGWGRSEKSFVGFPSHVSWYLARTEPGDLDHITFARNDHWLALSGGVHTPAAVATRIAGNLVEPELLAVPEYDWAIRGIKTASNAVLRGDVLPRPIVVRSLDHPRVVIIEGFTRFSAMMLAGRGAGTDVIVGECAEDDLHRWMSGGEEVRPRSSRRWPLVPVRAAIRDRAWARTGGSPSIGNGYRVEAG